MDKRKFSLEKVLCVVTTLFASGVIASLKVSDFLNPEYLPSTLLLEEAAVDSASDDLPLFNVTSDGDIRDAFDTMQYHRSMMNEYLCRSYIAEEILSEISPKNVGRLGVPAKNHRNHRPHDVLLKDQGSSTYRDWLSRSALLDDVYRHYDQMEDADESGDDMESGEVTGYAVQSGGNQKQPSYGPPSFDFGGGPPVAEIHYTGSGQGHGGSPQVVHEPVGGGERGDDHYYIEDEHSSGKGLAMKDLFDLALTALAFLAFGLFIMNLIMNCMLGAPQTTIMMQTTTMTSTTAEAQTAAGRRRRSLVDEQHLNEMAYRVLTSIDKMMEMNQARSSNSRTCFQYSLCKNNNYSRSLKGKYRIWLPVWSFGLSWLVGKIGEDRLGSLQASVLGLGGADCSKTYPSCSSRRKGEL